MLTVRIKRNLHTLQKFLSIFYNSSANNSRTANNSSRECHLEQERQQEQGYQVQQNQKGRQQQQKSQDWMVWNMKYFTPLKNSTELIGSNAA
jgi:hypothetical protein